MLPPKVFTHCELNVCLCLGSDSVMESDVTQEQLEPILHVVPDLNDDALNPIVPQHLDYYKQSSKKVIKHALRQQAKRRRKNTTIASGNTVSVPRIIVKPLPPPPTNEQITTPPPLKTPTMREVLASIPGFSIKPRKRSNKKLSTAAQLEQTKEGCIDLETADSILVNTNLRAILNKQTFGSLPSLYQHKLVQLLPAVDRQTVTNVKESIRLTSSSLNNEFFARACLEWQERLAEGEFTPENQQKLKTEADRERSRLDPWKLKHFEPIWGDRSWKSDTQLISSSRPPIRTTIKLRPSTATSSNLKAKPTPPSVVKRQRTVGAITRSCTNIKPEESECMSKPQMPDLLPIKNTLLKPTKLDGECNIGVANVSESGGDKIDTCSNSLSNLPEITIINISDAVAANTNCETIITNSFSSRVEKRRRTGSTDEHDESSAKRRSGSPIVTKHDLEIFPVVEVSPVDEEIKLEHAEPDNENPDDPLLDCDQVVLEVKAEDAQLAFSGEFMDDDDDDDDDEEESTMHFNDDDERSTTASLKEEDEDELKQTDDSKSWNDQNTPSSLSEPTHSDSADGAQMMPTTAYPMTLPNSLILQQGSPKIDAADFDSKLGSTVDESEILSNLSATNYEHQDVEVDEDRFLDAESYVLESGQISLSSGEKSGVACKEEPPVDLQAIFPSVGAEDCWDMVDSSTEKLLEVPLHALDSVPVGMVGDENTTEHVQVIPMQEELEVRLEEGSFPVPSDWPYDDVVKMDSEMVAAALGATDHPPANATAPAGAVPFVEFQGNQVKLELEVTLTPEIVTCDSLVTSSSISGTPNHIQAATVTPSATQGITTVIPPTTIVCLPSVVSASAGTHGTTSTAQNAVNMPRAGMVQSSSALPYLALSTSQPIRAVPAHTKVKLKAQGAAGRTRCGNKPPPGAVNLERSYQICQAVIQNSPNRDQLRGQLKPLPSLLAAATTASKTKPKGVDNNRTQYGNVSSSRGVKTFTPPLPAAGTFNNLVGNNHTHNNNNNNGVKVKLRAGTYQQRQPSPPVFVKHVFTSGQGIPVTMAVLPPAQALTAEARQDCWSQTADARNSVGLGGPIAPYILVQRAGVESHVPRSSSAPPSQRPTGTINSVGTMARGRPASVEADHPGPNPATQAITRRSRLPGQQQAVIYGDDENQVHNYTILSDTLSEHPGAVMKPKKADACPCNLRAMVMCKKCGAFCHDDCISANRLCSMCFIR